MEAKNNILHPTPYIPLSDNPDDNDMLSSTQKSYPKRFIHWISQNWFQWLKAFIGEVCFTYLPLMTFFTAIYTLTILAFLSPYISLGILTFDEPFQSVFNILLTQVNLGALGTFSLASGLVVIGAGWLYKKIEALFKPSLNHTLNALYASVWQMKDSELLKENKNEETCLERLEDLSPSQKKAAYEQLLAFCQNYLAVLDSKDLAQEGKNTPALRSHLERFAGLLQAKLKIEHLNHTAHDEKINIYYGRLKEFVQIHEATTYNTVAKPYEKINARLAYLFIALGVFIALPMVLSFLDIGTTDIGGLFNFIRDYK